ncbi:MAG: hypothetical protein ACYCY0_01860 [Acidithiobacillus ferrivorans]
MPVENPGPDLFIGQSLRTKDGAIRLTESIPLLALAARIAWLAVNQVGLSQNKLPQQ